MPNKKIAVAMSGGVDSSVAALLLKEQGFDVTGFFMQLWQDEKNSTSSKQTLHDVIVVAKQIGIPLQIVDLKKQFKKEVVDYFTAEYKCLKTPNPCVICNRLIKFGRLLDYVKKLGFDSLATGHYVRVLTDSQISNSKFLISNKFKNLNDKSSRNDSYHIFQGLDERKDQSYFLYQLGQKQLSSIIFPLGELTKKEVRQIAKKNKLIVHEKKESQEICFVQDDYRQFLKDNLNKKYFLPGDIIRQNGNKIGRHEGLLNYTIGQRKGIEQNTKTSILNDEASSKKPVYVLSFDTQNNQLVVGDEEGLLKDEITVKNLNVINASSNIANGLTCKVRYQSKGVSCSVELIDDTRAHIKLAEPVRAITPGQSAVLYRDDEVMGGGVIDK
jgi:tRNA-uridine 2-sulfurtransferase